MEQVTPKEYHVDLTVFRVLKNLLETPKTIIFLSCNINLNSLTILTHDTRKPHFKFKKLKKKKVNK